MSGPAITPTVCVRCGGARNEGDVTEPDDGLCTACYHAEWSIYLLEIARRGKKGEPGE